MLALPERNPCDQGEIVAFICWWNSGALWQAPKVDGHAPGPPETPATERALA
jgi:hypothetical protein